MKNDTQNELIEKLIGYASHDDECAINRYIVSQPCDCGYSAFIKAARALSAATAKPAPDENYEAAMIEIGEIVRVARDNPSDLVNFVKLNYPKEWRLTKEEHSALLEAKPAVDGEDISKLISELKHAESLAAIHPAIEGKERSLHREGLLLDAFCALERLSGAWPPPVDNAYVEDGCEQFTAKPSPSGMAGEGVEREAYDGDWINETTHDNGNYSNTCAVRERYFMGCKDRRICKYCYDRRCEALTKATAKPILGE